MNQETKVLSGILFGRMFCAALLVAGCGGGDEKKADKGAAKIDRSKEYITVLTGPTSGISGGH